jgi:hypothetical protein
MSMQDHAVRPLLGAILALSVYLAASLQSPEAAQAQATPPPPEQAEWEPTGLTGATSKLFTPASGAFFAVQWGDLYRSDDAGRTWHAVKQPPAAPPERRTGTPGWLLGVDPFDHTVLYVDGAEGLYKTDDDAATWRMVYRWDEISPAPSTMAISAADPAVVYLYFRSVNAPPPGDRRLLRSRDGGATWDEISPDFAKTLCESGYGVFAPHAGDAQRVFIAGDCESPRPPTANLYLSSDQGEHWSLLFDGKQQGAFPRRIVGGGGATPRRLYLATRKPAATGGAYSISLFRSDDDGQTWTEQQPFGTEVVPGDDVGGLAYDPANPDQLYVARAAASTTVEVATSSDGGATWTQTGKRNLGTIYDLAFGVDGRNLYAATDRGVFRLRLR